MITAREPLQSTRRRVPAAVAAGLALIGVVLIVIASCSSQPGAPQPTAAQSGTIDNSNSLSMTLPSSAAESTPVSASTTSVEPPSSAPSTASVTPEPSAAPAPSSAAPPPPLGRPATGLLLPAAQPIALNIPAIGASSALLNLGVNPDSTIEVPPVDEPDSKAGWFDKSPLPGTIGPSIIVGHIDSAKYGPGIFYNLGKLNPGDTIEITRDDNTVAIFGVDAVRVYAKADFPTKEVYGNLDHAGLRLITCGGAFNSDTGHYEDNTIAFATLISSRAA